MVPEALSFSTDLGSLSHWASKSAIACSRVSTVLGPGTHYLMVDGYDGGSFGPYTMELRWRAGFAEGDAAVEVRRGADERGPFARISPALAVPSVPASMTFRDADVRPGSTYWYEVVRADVVPAVLAGPVRVTMPAGALALHVAGSRTGALQVEYEVPVRGRVRVELYAVNGCKLRTLLDARREAGSCSASRTVASRISQGTRLAKVFP